MQICNYGKFSRLTGRSGVMISGLFLGCLVQQSFAQDSAPADLYRPVGHPRITWADQFPASKEDNDIHGNRRFLDFVLGKKNSLPLTKPVNVVAKNRDEYWVLDQANGMIFHIDRKVGDIPHVRGRQFLRFPSLVGFCSLPGDKMLFTDSYLNKIFAYDPGKKEIRILNDSTAFDQPTGIAYSGVNHEIWVVETKLHSISVLDEEGRRKKTIGKRGTGPGEFNYPTSIWIDKSGNAYVVDALNFRVQIFDKEGKLISVFGKNGDGGGNFARPKGIATDSYGNIYIADALFNAVQVFDLSGNFLYTFGSQGQDKGEFWMPCGIYIDDEDFIYIADSYNSKVQVFQFINEDQK